MKVCSTTKTLNKQVAPLALAMLIMLLAIGSVTAQPISGKGQVIFDRYYSIWINNQRCGYARTAIRQSPGQITSLNYLNMTISQYGRDMPIVVKTVSREKTTGQLISFKTSLWTNGSLITKTASLQGKQLLVTTRLFNQEVEECFDIPPDGFVTELQTQRLIMSLLLKPGRQLELTVLSPQGGATPFLPASIEVIGPEIIQAYDQAISAVKVKTHIVLQNMQITGLDWFDKHGVLASRVNFSGMDLYLQAVEKDQARKGAAKADLTDISLIVPKVPLKNPSQTQRAVYRLKLKNSQAGPLNLPQTDMQRVLAKGSDYVDIELTRQNPTQSPSLAAEQPPPKLSQYLRSSLYLDWQTPAVKAAAKSVRGDSQKPWDLALALWKYVDRTIVFKNLEVFFDPASKILASRQGDCTEHAVLLAALARARGLPSRVVTGLTQVNNFAGHKAVFGYHAWTELWIDGQWISLDAALAQAPVDVSHIALSVLALNSSEPTVEASAGILPVIGNLDIEVLQQE